MKFVLPFAATIFLALAPSAYAEQPKAGYEALYEAPAHPWVLQSAAPLTPHDHQCVGLAAGTAHHSCGTATGGPSGGLF